MSEKYFKKYKNASTFNEVLRKGKFVDLLIDLNQDFNGNVFTWTEEEQKQLQSLDLNILADFYQLTKQTSAHNKPSSNLIYDILSSSTFL